MPRLPRRSLLAGSAGILFTGTVTARPQPMQPARIRAIDCDAFATAGPPPLQTVVAEVDIVWAINGSDTTDHDTVTINVEFPATYQVDEFWELPEDGDSEEEGNFGGDPDADPEFGGEPSFDFDLPPGFDPPPIIKPDDDADVKAIIRSVRLRDADGEQLDAARSECEL